MAPGIFNGLWGGISNTIGLGAAEISEKTGSADKKRAQELALTNLSVTQQQQKASDKRKMIIIIAVIVIIILGIIVKARRN